MDRPVKMCWARSLHKLVNSSFDDVHQHACIPTCTNRSKVKHARSLSCHGGEVESFVGNLEGINSSEELDIGGRIPSKMDQNETAYVKI